MIGKLVIYLLSNLGVQIYHRVIPQQTDFPGITYTIISQDAEYQKGGIQTIDEGRVQIDIYHLNDSSAWALVNEIRAILEGWAGTYDGYVYNYTTLETITESYNEVFDMHVVIMDFIFRKKGEIPN